MIAYRHPSEELRTKDVLAHVRTTRPDHVSIVATLIDLCQVESGIADDACRDVDRETPASKQFDAAARLAGRALSDSWRLGGSAGGRALSTLRASLESMAVAGLPERLAVPVPEGFAYYGLYPESYVEAARRYHRQRRPESVFCIGIRTTGAALSAAVAGTLETLGCRVERLTVRPRGHPFDRQLQLDADVERRMAAHRSDFLVVDEGPGLSGSSFGSVAAALERLGVPGARIVLMPSWLPDAPALLSESGRRCFARHESIVATFEEIWRESGKLERALQAGDLVDLSAGAWRGRLYGASASFPAAHPQHERRKYLAAGGRIFRFAGLGRYGRSKLARAEGLFDVGLGARPVGLTQGFLALPWIEGRPVEREDTGPELVTAVARYMAGLTRSFPAKPDLGWAELAEMTEVNAAESLPNDALDGLARLCDWRSLIDDAPAVALDGRMLAHEWIRTAAGFVKTDAIDHHDDHFFPGCADPAWDLAAATMELALPPDAQDLLVRTYVACSGDADVAARLPFYRVCYSAFRVGYATLAAQTLGSSDDGARFTRERQRYRLCLTKALAML